MPRSWQPSTDNQVLRQRAAVIDQIRYFFKQRHVLEVETSVLERFPANEADLARFKLDNHYLRTSHEIGMRRLFAAGNSDIFQIGKVFRDDVAGPWHNPEFTMLEWYRQAYDYQRLMTEVDELIQWVCKPYRQLSASTFITCEELFKDTFNFDTLINSASAWVEKAREMNAEHCNNTYDAFDFLIDTAARQTFSDDHLTFLYNYPESHALLAKVDNRMALRFEVYWGKMELVNGYAELTDSAEFLERYQQERQRELELGLPEMPLNDNLYTLLEDGLPACSGASLGLDRLLMLILNKPDLSAVIPFIWDNT